MNIKTKAEKYAMSFFFSIVPDDWSYEDLTHHLRNTNEDTVEQMAYMVNQEEYLNVWEPFEHYNPSWIADQMDVMSQQLEDLFK